MRLLLVSLLQVFACAAGRRGERDEMQDAHTIVHDLWTCADPKTKTYEGVEPSFRLCARCALPSPVSN